MDRGSFSTINANLTYIADLNEVLQIQYKTTKVLLKDTFNGKLDEKVQEKLEQLRAQIIKDGNYKQQIESQVRRFRQKIS